MRTVTVRGVNLTIHERGDWESSTEPVTGPAPFPDQVHTCVAHYPGASASWQPPADVAKHLREGQHSYLVDPNRGYSYGYGWVIGPNPFPDIWEVRGFDIRNAANNGDFEPYKSMTNPSWNGRTVSIQIMCSTEHPPTADQVRSFQYCLAMCDDFYGETLDLKGHKDSDFTDCPGPMYPMLPELGTRPLEEGDLTVEELDAALAPLKADLAELQRTKLSTERFNQFASNDRERFRATLKKIGELSDATEMKKALTAFRDAL